MSPISVVDKVPPKVAFLGPEGTYTHQAAFNRFGTGVDYVAKESIAETLRAIPSEASIAVLPEENSIFGTVIETLDLLRLPEVGKEKVIAGEVTLQVQHCLLAAQGTKLKDIRNVLSHEQALGQCSNYLQKYLPDATCTKMPSTAAAAEAVLAPDAGNSSAAISSEICTSVYPGLVLLERGIQNEHDNFTKFWIMTSPSSNPIPCLMPAKTRNALIRISSSSECLVDLSLLIVQLGLLVLRIDRRPSIQSIPFHDVYFFHVSNKLPQTGIDQLEDTVPWRDRVESALGNARAQGWQACTLGLW
ncbi:hypothetical protein ACEPAG_711 [Sanghuangporus baumii]